MLCVFLCSFVPCWHDLLLMSSWHVYMCMLLRYPCIMIYMLIDWMLKLWLDFMSISRMGVLEVKYHHDLVLCSIYHGSHLAPYVHSSLFIHVSILFHDFDLSCCMSTWCMHMYGQYELDYILDSFLCHDAIFIHVFLSFWFMCTCLYLYPC